MDYRKSLPMLREEWRSCVKCELGVRRINAEGQFVFGEGERGGVMFVGEGPGKDEETSGHPFVGRSGQILRETIKRLGLSKYYITNIVACRSCSPWLNEVGEPVLRKNWKTRQMETSCKDEPPTPLQAEACKPRLDEEIYLVDPVIIVALGNTAARSLLGKSVAITSPDVRGIPVHISIPGAGFRTVRTDKRGTWVRRSKAGVSLPTAPSEVRYLCVPTLHPSFVARRMADPGGDSFFRMFVDDVRRAVQIYERYALELYGTIPSGMSESVIDNDFEPPDQE